MAYDRTKDAKFASIVCLDTEIAHELLGAFAQLLDAHGEADTYADDNGQLYADVRRAWIIWRKIAGDDRVPDVILEKLAGVWCDDCEEYVADEGGRCPECGMLIKGED